MFQYELLHSKGQTLGSSKFKVGISFGQFVFLSVFSRNMLSQASSGCKFYCTVRTGPDYLQMMNLKIFSNLWNFLNLQAIIIVLTFAKLLPQYDLHTHPYSCKIQSKADRHSQSCQAQAAWRCAAQVGYQHLHQQSLPWISWQRQCHSMVKQGFKNSCWIHEF